MTQLNLNIAKLEKELAAKNRELEIEKAFEKVRACAMAMRHSSDLQEVVNLVAQQLNNVSLDITGVFMVINNEEIDKQFTFWGSTGVAETYMKRAAIPYLDRPIYRELAEATTKGEKFFVEEFTRKEKIEFFEHLFKHPPYNSSTPEWKEEVLSREGGYTRSVSVSQYTSIFVVNHHGRKLSDDDNEILKRFGEVFEQSYTRFLDLQKAEARAFEAIKQASVDRVRGEIASMRTSEDLNRITPLLWRELETLEVPFIRCGIFIVYEEKEKVQAYLTTPDGKSLGVLNLSFDSNELTSNTVKHWKKNRVYKEHWSKKDFINWTKSMIEIGQVQTAETYQGSSTPPESLYLHFVPFAQGMLYVGNVSPLTDEKLELVKTLANAFSIAYVRYEDFINIEEAKNKIEITLNELKTAQAQLQALDKSKSRFFANISHEFRTPLTLILGQIQSVMSSGLNTKEKGKLQVANRNANRLLDLINQLLDLSKIEAGSMELRSTDQNIVLFLKNIFYSFESLAESQDITLKFESMHDHVLVKYDPDKMEKVFNNLLSNAFKFTPAGGKIKVSLSLKPGNIVEINLADSGIGISKEKVPFVFDRFYQADEDSYSGFEGTGIGLALAKELIELHSGRISVDSVSGKGSVFTLQLPVSDPSEYIKTTMNEADTKIQKEDRDSLPTVDTGIMVEDSHDSRDKIILIVEDNNDIREYIKEQIKDDYKTIEAIDGRDGINKAEKYIPDLIITDVMMPKMDGYQFAESIRKNFKTSHIPIIMLTAKAALDDKITGLEKGVDAYLTKPFNAKELSVRIKSLIHQREELRKRFKTSTVIKPSEVSSDSVDQIFFKKITEIIEENINKEILNIEFIASNMNMSVSQLNRKLNALISQTAGKLISSMRLQRAADLIRNKKGNIAEICYQAGFNDQAYFSRAFKKQFGCSPTNFKKLEN